MTLSDDGPTKEQAMFMHCEHRWSRWRKHDERYKTRFCKRCGWQHWRADMVDLVDGVRGGNSPNLALRGANYTDI